MPFNRLNKLNLTMKKIAVLSVALFAVLIGCKKDKDPNPVDVENVNIFWAINNDSSQTYSVFGMFMDDTVVLKPGERTKVYKGKPGSYAVSWAQQNPADTNYALAILQSPHEIILMINSGPDATLRSLKHASSCTAPVNGKAVVRALDYKGYSDFELINGNNDTIKFKANSAGMMDTSNVSCSIVNPGDYNLIARSGQQSPMNMPSVSLKSGAVYLIYPGYDNKIHVVER